MTEPKYEIEITVKKIQEELPPKKKNELMSNYLQRIGKTQEDWFEYEDSILFSATAQTVDHAIEQLGAFERYMKEVTRKAELDDVVI